MKRNDATYDVFIAFDHRNLATAKGVAETLRSYGLEVLLDTQQLPPGDKFEDALWQAMAESYALVVVLPEGEGSGWISFALGAAKAWNKPIYAVSDVSTHAVVPATLRNHEIFPVSRLSEVALSIVRSSNPLSAAEIELLGNLYQKRGVSADQLLSHPQHLGKLADDFNAASGRQMAGEELMRHFLRLRKRGLLPSLSQRRPVKHTGSQRTA